MKEITRYERKGQDPVIWETDGTSHFISWGSRSFDTDYPADAGATFGAWLAEALPPKLPELGGRGEYRIYWAIDLNADNPVEAARLAKQMQMDSEGTANFFEVEKVDENDRLSGVRIPVDLDEVDRREGGNWRPGGDWREHDGGPFPLSMDLKVEAQLRSGAIGKAFARDLCWEHAAVDPTKHIVRYRIIHRF